MSQWHFEIMSEQQAELLHSLGPVAAKFGYYLAGGTAVALHLGHRQSIDFDWFGQAPSVKPADTPARLQAEGLAFDVKTSGDTLTDGYVNEIKTTFIEYTYPTLQPPAACDEYGCSIADLVDLGCMKLWAAANRGSRKDFLDIYAMIRHGFELTDLLANYRAKYGSQDVMPVLYGLTYFDDAEKEPMPRMFIEHKWSQIKSVIQEWTRRGAG